MRSKLIRVFNGGTSVFKPLGVSFQTIFAHEYNIRSKTQVASLSWINNAFQGVRGKSRRL